MNAVRVVGIVVTFLFLGACFGSRSKKGAEGPEKDAVPSLQQDSGIDEGHEEDFDEVEPPVDMPDGDFGLDDHQPGEHPDAVAECNEEGSERPAMADEVGSLCVCDRGSWVCYGPDENADPAGGARGAPPAECSVGDVTSSGGSCLVTYSRCSDGHSYMLACIDAICGCYVDGVSTVELAPMDACPEGRAEVNGLCGWELEAPPDSPGT